MSEAGSVGETSSSVRSKKPLMCALIIAISGVAAFSTTSMGYWVPHEVLSGRGKDKIDNPTQFVSLPQFAISLPGKEYRTAIVAIQIETDQQRRAEVEYLTPRLVDTFNTFLAGIDVSAFSARGILDVIRSELATRAAVVLGPAAFTDILITEFRIK
ncbi:flagellar basal body-associated FliL family protein [Paracoccus ravus]|uniref:flagellar basal body-associated FliL family protein n=1 Tax=Paracoccus ravus TaxID=2447760 RepID=UPI00106E4277|nr:flagellar basal body-associated FliL family protein [Paracoccus ravus]